MEPNGEKKRRAADARKAERYYKRMLSEIGFENYVAGLAAGPSEVVPPLNSTPEGGDDVAVPPIDLSDDLPPLSEEEDIAVDSGDECFPAADSSDEEDADVIAGEPIEVTVPDRPYGDKSFEEGLRLWALTTGQTHRAIDLLLCHLRQHNPDYHLPRNARTFLRTPVATSRSSELTDVPGGKQWYQGIEKCLRSYFRNVLPTAEGFVLDLFLDGLPLFQSSRTQFWPILMKVHNVPNCPVMTVAIFCGQSKPSSLEKFLRPLVTELNKLITGGVSFGTRKFFVNLRTIIADTPARSFAKGVQSHNSYHGCLKCTIVAEREGHRMYFPHGSPCAPRTDELFRAGAYPLHVKMPTPLSDLIGFDLILQMIVSEQMHLIDKGIVAKLLFLWIHGFGRLVNKLTPQRQRELSAHMRSVKVPSDFRRRLRDLQDVRHWKASEFKMFLLVVGPAVLKGRLPDAAYQHFMLLFVAITMLSSTQHETQWEYANRLLHRFVADYGQVYDPVLVNSNVHNLLHVYEEVCTFGELGSMSAYPFEGKLHDLKKLVRTGRHTLEQAVNRLQELEQSEAATTHSIAPEATVSVRSMGSDIIAVLRRDFLLRKNFGDQWFLTNSGCVVRYETAAINGANVVVKGCVFNKQESAFDDPCPSEVVNIHAASMADLETGTLHAYTSEQILCKVAAIQTVREGTFMFMPMPHTYASRNIV